MAKRVADLLVDVLLRSGRSADLRRHRRFAQRHHGFDSHHEARSQWVHTRHEEAAAFAAGAEAHLTGKLAVCAGSCGPGNLHLINGLYDCQRSRVPVLAIAAQIPSAKSGADIFRRLIRSSSSRSAAITASWSRSPSRCRACSRLRCRLRSRGAALPWLPFQGMWPCEMPSSKRPRLHFSEPRPTVCPSDDELNVLAELLNRSKKITILGGAGCAGAHDELVELAGKLQAPIVHAMRGKEFIEYDNPFDVGMTGLLGFSSGYHAMMNCEMLLMIGTDFPYQQFFPKDATIVQIDLRGEQLGRRSKVDFGFVGDTKTTLRALLPKLEQNQYEAHLKESLEHYRKARKGLDELATPNSGKKPIHPQYVARVLDQLASEDAIFTCDVGTPTIWAARYLTMNGKRRITRFLHPRVDGQRIAAGDRRTGQLSRPAGDLDVGRWRLRDAHGRTAHAAAARNCR